LTPPWRQRNDARHEDAFPADDALNCFGVIAAFAAYRYEGKAAIVTPLAVALSCETRPTPL
jgi:hypothetical protein